MPVEELSEICTKLWELDSNRCEPGVDYEIDLQGNLQHSSITNIHVILSIHRKLTLLRGGGGKKTVKLLIFQTTHFIVHLL